MRLLHIIVLAFATHNILAQEDEIEQTRDKTCPNCVCPICEDTICPECAACAVTDCSPHIADLSSAKKKLMEVSSSFAECTANLKSSESTASHLETKLNSQKEDASSDAAESHKKLMTAQAEVKRVTKEWNAAKEKITELQTHNTFHKDISSSGYCNYTAIMVSEHSMHACMHAFMHAYHACA